MITRDKAPWPLFFCGTSVSVTNLNSKLLVKLKENNFSMFEFQNFKKNHGSQIQTIYD